MLNRQRSFFARLTALFTRKRSERDLDAEMQAHLAMHIEDNLSRGMSPRHARREALLKLGGLEQTKEVIRLRRGLPWLEVLFADIRFGARMLRKDFGFTFVAVLMFALGIAANATIFTFVSAVLYRRPPVEDPDRLAVVFATSTTRIWGANQNPVSAPSYFDWKHANQVFSDMAAVDAWSSANLTGEGPPEHVRQTRATWNYFSVLGVLPELGRTFVAGEGQSGHDRVVIVSHELWERRFGSDQELIGRSIRLGGEPYTVIGVMPQRFQIMGFQAEVWIPLVLDEARQNSAERETRSFFLVARVKPGVRLEQAQANVRTLGTITARTFPDTENGWGADTQTLQEFIIRDFNAGPIFALLLCTVGFVLLIACANIAGLLLARATGRAKEIAVRVAIGAGKARIVRQLMTEALLIAMLGVLAGLALTLVGARLMQSALSFNEAVRVLELRMDWHVLAFTAGISALAAVLFGLTPALRAWSVDVNTSLKNESAKPSGTRAKNRLRSVLVTAEVALAVVLLSGAGILIKALLDGTHANLGFQPQGLLTAQISLPDTRYATASKQIEFYRDLLQRLESTPGTSYAALANTLPASGPGMVSFRLRGQEDLLRGDRARARYMLVSPHFFDAGEIPLLAGRVFSDTDDSNAPPVALVSEKFAERFFPNGNAVGNQLLIDSPAAPANRWCLVVGVVRNLKSWPLQRSDDPEIYEPFLQRPASEVAVLVRAHNDSAKPGGRTDANALASALRAAVWAIDKDQPISAVASMPDVLENQTGSDRILSGLMATFAGMALVLAVVGLYGLLAYSVGQRRREIGIRVALGAESSGVVRLVIFEGMKLALAGVAIGVSCALALPRILGSLLQDYPISPGSVLALVPLVISSAALLACYIPARRAARVDPMVALRYE